MKKNVWMIGVVMLLSCALPVQASSEEEAEAFQELEEIEDINLPDLSDEESADALLDELENFSEEVVKNEKVQKMMDLPIVKQLYEFIESLLNSVFQLLFDFIEET